MRKHENLLFMPIFTLICCILLAACSTTDIGSDKQSETNVTTAATAINESKTTETTTAAKAQKETKSVKETVSTQPTSPAAQTDVKTEETEYYEEYYDPYYEEDYDQSDYDGPEQDHDQYDDWEENDYDSYEHEHSFYRHGTIYPTAHHDGAIVYECDCGESYTEPIPCTGDEPHDVFADYMELIDQYTTTESTPDGERIRNTYVYQCTICGYIEEIYYQDD